MRAEQVLIGSFSNLSAVVTHLAGIPNPIHLVCAGTNGTVTGEDVLFAGAVVAALSNRDSELVPENDSARIAADFWRSHSGHEEDFRRALLDSQGGRNLRKLGLSRDIDRAGQRDRFRFVPVWNPDSNDITD
jgi:2-phosphosulfolactate phosphatase